jgi:acylphosphatase
MMIPTGERRMPSSYRFVVTGRVQGVGFRAATRRKAQSLGLTGWVRNRNDGAVEGVASSRDAKSLDAFRQWLQQGPPIARVARVDWRADHADDPGDRFEVLD